MRNIREKFLNNKVTIAPNVFGYAFSKEATHSTTMHVASAIYYTLISIDDRLSANDMFEACRFIQACKARNGYRKGPEWLQADIKDKLALLVQGKLFNQPLAWELDLKGHSKWFSACVKAGRRKKLNALDVISYAWYLISTPLSRCDIEEKWLSTLIMHGQNDFINSCCAMWERKLSKKYKRGMRGFFAEKYGKDTPYAANFN